jgi:hypothetical protein
MSQIQKHWLGILIFGGLATIVYASESLGGLAPPFPTPLDAYGDADLIKSGDVMAVLANRIEHSPFNVWASLIFLFAILHTFFAVKITGVAAKMELAHASKMKEEGKSEEEIEHNPPVGAEILCFFGEVEAIFGIWVLVLAAVTIYFYDWTTFRNYIAHEVNYTEPMFVVVIMTLASTRPVMTLAR